MNVSWDCEWSVTPSYLGEAIGFSDETHLNNLTIINSGDPEYADNGCALEFRLNHNLLGGRIFFDGFDYKPSNVYPVLAENNVTIEVNVSSTLLPRGFIVPEPVITTRFIT